MGSVKCVFIWLIMAVVIVIGVGSLNWVSYRRLVTRGVSTSATVLELLPNNHNTVRYEYQVAGRTFRGRMQSWGPNPPLEQLSVGQVVIVYYDPEQPGESVLGDPKPIFKNETISIALAAVVFPSILVFALARRAAGNRANQSVF